MKRHDSDWAFFWGLHPTDYLLTPWRSCIRFFRFFNPNCPSFVAMANSHGPMNVGTNCEYKYTFPKKLSRARTNIICRTSPSACWQSTWISWRSSKPSWNLVWLVRTRGRTTYEPERVKKQLSLSRKNSHYWNSHCHFDQKIQNFDKNLTNHQSNLG